MGRSQKPRAWTAGPRQTHSLTHHGNDEGKIAELRKIEEAQLRGLARMLDGLDVERPARGNWGRL